MAADAVVVHLVSYASQPDVVFACGQEAQAGWNQPKGLPPSVYMADIGSLYTFTKELATCQQCVASRKEGGDG